MALPSIPSKCGDIAPMLTCTSLNSVLSPHRQSCPLNRGPCPPRGNISDVDLAADNNRGTLHPHPASKIPLSPAPHVQTLLPFRMTLLPRKSIHPSVLVYVYKKASIDESDNLLDAIRIGSDYTEIRDGIRTGSASSLHLLFQQKISGNYI